MLHTLILFTYHQEAITLETGNILKQCPTKNVLTGQLWHVMIDSSFLTSACACTGTTHAHACACAHTHTHTHMHNKIEYSL
jgi:hypothetical protein